MNWNEATLEQCWDFLNNRIGSNISWLCPDGTTRDVFPPPTLDSIAASLPEDCVWSEIEWIDGSNEWKSTARKSGSQCMVHAYADIEILSRARCVCLMLEASGK